MKKLQKLQHIYIIYIILYIFTFKYIYLQILLEKFLCCKNLQLLYNEVTTTIFPIILQNRDRITIENAAKTDQDRRSGIKKEI